MSLQNTRTNIYLILNATINAVKCEEHIISYDLTIVMRT